MPPILHLPYNLPCHVLQPCSGGSWILLHRPLLCSSLNSASWIFLLNLNRGERYQAFEKLERCHERTLTNSPGTRPHLFLHASYQDYSKHRSLFFLQMIYIHSFQSRRHKEGDNFPSVLVPLQLLVGDSPYCCGQPEPEWRILQLKERLQLPQP